MPHAHLARFAGGGEILVANRTRVFTGEWDVTYELVTTAGCVLHHICISCCLWEEIALCNPPIIHCSRRLIIGCASKGAAFISADAFWDPKRGDFAVTRLTWLTILAVLFVGPVAAPVA